MSTTTTTTTAAATQSDEGDVLSQLPPLTPPRTTTSTPVPRGSGLISKTPPPKPSKKKAAGPSKRRRLEALDEALEDSPRSDDSDPTTSDERFIDDSAAGTIADTKVFEGCSYNPHFDTPEEAPEAYMIYLHMKSIDWLSEHPDFATKLNASRRKFNEISKRSKHNMERDEDGHFVGYTQVLDLDPADRNARSAQKHCAHNAQGGGVCDGCYTDLYHLYEEALLVRAEKRDKVHKKIWKEHLEDEASQALD